MSHYLLRRSGQGLLVLWAAFTLSFVLLQVLPGDAVLIKFQNPDLGLSPEQIAEMRLAYGADSPLREAVFPHAMGMLRGDFWLFAAGRAAGQRAYRQQPAGDIKPGAARLCAGGGAGVHLAFAARLPGLRWLSNTLQSLPVLFIALPTFWLGIALIQLFSFQLRWIPVINPGPVEGLILPCIAVAVPISAPLAQILMRVWIRSPRSHLSRARAKGLSETGVLWRHVTGNALLPVLNIAGLLLGN